MSKSNSSSGGIGFMGLLTIVFVIAKITGYITWSWWLVFCPVLIGLVLVCIILALVGVVIYLKEKI